jgi:hypothetical protein
MMQNLKHRMLTGNQPGDAGHLASPKLILFRPVSLCPTDIATPQLAKVSGSRLSLRATAKMDNPNGMAETARMKPLSAASAHPKSGFAQYIVDGGAHFSAHRNQLGFQLEVRDHYATVDL